MYRRRFRITISVYRYKLSAKFGTANEWKETKEMRKGRTLFVFFRIDEDRRSRDQICGVLRAPSCAAPLPLRREIPSIIFSPESKKSKAHSSVSFGLNRRTTQGTPSMQARRRHKKSRQASLPRINLYITVAFLNLFSLSSPS